MGVRYCNRTAGSQRLSPLSGAGRWGRIGHATMLGEHAARLGIVRGPGRFGQHGCVPRLPIVLQTIEDVPMAVLEIGALARILNDVA